MLPPVAPPKILIDMINDAMGEGGFRSSGLNGSGSQASVSRSRDFVRVMVRDAPCS
jgi:hypothetical protein